MKKIFLSLAIAAFLTTAFTVSPSVDCKAQSTKLTSKTITAVDTVTFSAVPSMIKSFTYNLTKTSGTVAGNVYLEGSTISGSWDLIDSLTLANVTTLQKKTVVITSVNYLSYRWRNTNTSSATAAVKAAWLRREDDQR